MKFGKYLEAEQVPEWDKMYVDYKGLKRQVKIIASAMEKGTGTSTGEEQISLLRRASTYLGYNSFSPGAVEAAAAGNSHSATLVSFPDSPSAQIAPEIAIASEQPLRRELANNSETCSRAGCTKCAHFSSIVSASPQIAMNMSAGNMGKVATTSMALAHDANIKIPISAQDSFTNSIRHRRLPVASGDCISSALHMQTHNI
ncbi:hypothetical protein J3B02_004410 [Coemansia erecta]|nr:hypothetical protein J3B02_004410 [Coemansia erecta]